MKYVGFLLLMFLCSCVGVTEQGDAQKAISNKYNNSSIIFDGVEELKGISHNKMEVYFYPARGGSGKYSYKIYYGGEPLPQVISSDVLNVDYRGLLRHTITGLEPARDYIVRVDVEDQITKELTPTVKTSVETTYSNRVVDFYGISSASNLAGTDGLDSLLIRWTHARCIDDMLCDQAHDPSRYEIILLDRTDFGLNPSSFYDTNLNQDNGRLVVPVQFSASNNLNEYVVRGLKPKTEYYVLVRSVHRGAVDDLNRPRLSGEMNNAYRLISTLDNDLAGIDFDLDSVKIENLSGENALTALRVKWNLATGVFDHYRLYYGPVTANLSEGHLDNCKAFLGPLDDIMTTVLCKKIGHSENETIIAGLATQTDYKLMVVVCQTATCRHNERVVGYILDGTTSLENPTFSGLSVIATAGSITDFGSLRLRFDPLDTNVTYADGFVIGYKNNPSAEVTEYTEIGLDPYEFGSTPLYVDRYNPLTASEIIVRNVEYYSGQTYCFKIFPYTYDQMGNRRTFENENWKCINNPTYKAPTRTEFQGLKVVKTSGTRVTLRWDRPSTGVYEGFELFYKLDNGDSSFSYSQALYEIANFDPSETAYRSIVGINSNVTEFTITDVDDGEAITFGIMTYYYSPDAGIIRSEDNSGMIRCLFVEGQNNDCVNL